MAPFLRRPPIQGQAFFVLLCGRDGRGCDGYAFISACPNWKSGLLWTIDHLDWRSNSRSGRGVSHTFRSTVFALADQERVSHGTTSRTASEETSPFDHTGKRDSFDGFTVYDPELERGPRYRRNKRP